MNNRPRKRCHRKHNAKFKAQILRKEQQRKAKYPLRAEYTSSVFLTQNEKRGA